MKIQLIHPPVYVNDSGLTALRPSLPLGLAYIAAVLEQDGHQVSVIDALGEAPDRKVPDGDIHRLGLSIDEIVERIDADTKAVGVTLMWSYAWPIVRELLHRIREIRPDLKIVCGGEHFTATTQLSMEQAPVDYIVRGEGEETAVALFRALELGLDHSVIAGIAWRKPGEDGGEEIVINPSRDRVKNIDEIPWPAWHLFDVQGYDENEFITGIRYGRTVPILATRGCPYQCTYCSSPGMWTTRWYARTPKDVVDEIEKNVERYGASNFPFQDLTAILKRDWVVDFANEILERKLEITWQLPAGTRSEIIDDEVATLLRRSGCRSLNFAPESGSERTRKHMKKMLTDEKLFRAVKAARKNKLNIGIFLVLGYPTDEPQDMKATVRMIRRLALEGVDDVAAGFFFPLPNTEIFRELETRGEVQLDDSFLKLPIYVHNNYLSEDRNYNWHMSAKQLTRWKYWIVLNFYLTSFARRPWRVPLIFWNFLLGKETRKLESFLRVRLKQMFGGRKRKRTSTTPVADASPASNPHEVTAVR
jgi:anaerobic magnesium-protoporphyrin IX monomethyl ester cyclase